MDNSGAYVTYKELFDRLYPSTYVSEKSVITLSAKNINVFEYVDNSFSLQEGDIICQGEYAQKITALQTSPNRITLEDATNINNGTAYVYRAAKTIEEFTMYRSMAMQKIDLITGQWFNKRTLSNVKYEGNNSYMLHLPVPIIEITSMKINNADDVLDTTMYQVFNSRTLPDDRRNPRIKLFALSRNIYTQTDFTHESLFYKGKFTYIDGSFGYLEEDGSTPEAIKFVTARLVMTELTRDPEETEQRVIKKEKVDLHEVEYETKTSTSAGGNAGGINMTGDEEVDRILAMYKSPISVGGTDPFFSTIIQFHKDYRIV